MSDNLDKLAILQDRINEFSHTLYAAQLKKFEHVAEVFDTELLSGLTLEQVKEILRNKVMDHINKKGINVHNVTAKQLGTLTGEVTQDLIDELLDSKSDLPLSYYGPQDYLPAPFLPNFTNIGNITDTRDIIHLVEADDTWVGLTNTTDGSVRSVSWVYLKNVSTRPASDVIRTGVQYAPSFISEHEHPLYVCGDSTSFLLYCTEGGSSVISRVYLVLTNGTLDPGRNSVADVTGKIGVLPGRTMSSFIHKGILYLLIFRSDMTLGYDVKSVKLSDLSSPTLTINNVLGWNNRRPGLGNSTDPYIKIAETTTDIIKTVGKEIIINIGNLGDGLAPVGGPLILESEIPGRFYLITHGSIHQRAVDGIASWINLNYYIRSIITVDSKTVDHPNIFGNDRLTITYQGSQITHDSNGMAKYSHSTRSMFDTKSRFWTISRVYLSNRGVYVRPSIHQYANFTINLTISKFDESKPLDEITSCSVDYLTDTSMTLPLSSPSLLGAPIGIISSLGDKALLVSSTSRNLSGGPSIFCEIPDDSLDYRYGSVSVGERTGIAPNDNRRYLSDVDPLAPPTPYLISEVNKSRVQVNHSCVDMFHSTPSLNPTAVRFHSISNAGIFTKSGSNIRVHSFTYNKDKLLGDLIARAKSFGYPVENIIQTSVELVVSKHIGLNKSIAILHAIYSLGQKNECLTLICRVNVTMSGDAVTEVDLLPGSSYRLNLEQNALSLIYTPSSISIREMSNGEVMIGYVPPTHITIPGTNFKHNVLMKLDVNGGLTILNHTRVSGDQPLVRQFVNFPNKGLYYSACGSHGGLSTDFGFKSIGILVCDLVSPTSWNFQTAVNSINSGTGSKVILSTEAANNWSLYFTQDMPVMINGVAGVVPKTTFTLNSETDQWGEWHVWVYRTGDQFRYKLTKESTTQPDDNHLYLGYVHTKGKTGGVFRTNIEKSVAIGGYRLSKWVAGKSIPVSEGEVTVPKHLNWV